MRIQIHHKFEVSLLACVKATLFVCFSGVALCGLASEAKADMFEVLTVLHAFSGVDSSGANPDGAAPDTGLLLGSDGNFYGTAEIGGAGYGTVFKLTPDGTLTSLHAFDGQDGDSPRGRLIEDEDGNIYGTTFGKILLGATSNADTGSVFKIGPDGVFTNLHLFSAVGKGPVNSDGANPVAGLLFDEDDDIFYGTTQQGGPGGVGTIFSLTPDGVLTTLYSFDPTTTLSGESPRAGLVETAGGVFYGTTSQDPNTTGTVFRFTAGRAPTTLHLFSNLDDYGHDNDGATPYGKLLQASNGNFYGTTSQGGKGGGGTIFKIDKSTSILTTVYTFSAVNTQGINSDGANPYAGLIEGGDGNFYGTTTRGGKGSGTIFSVTPAGVLTTLYSFSKLDGQGSNADGATPICELIRDSDGALYGTTIGGGANGSGTVFKVAQVDVAPSALTLTAPVPSVTVSSGEAGEFLLTLANAEPVDVTVSYKVGGTAVGDTDYAALKGTARIKAGKTSKTISVQPQGNLGGATKKTVVLTLQSGKGYTVGTTGKVKVKILGH